MNQSETLLDLAQALEISREIVRVAAEGDADTAVSLDAERRRLLEAARSALSPLEGEAARMMREITELNDRAIGSLQHRLRAKERDFDLITAGKRAVRAYGEVTARG